MPDYQKGKVYTIRNYNDNSLIYVGSTCNTLYQRFNNHKQTSKKRDKIPLYQKVENWEDWYIELYESYPCNNKDELTRREGQVIREIATLNRVIPHRTVKEYRDENREHIREYDRNFREANREKLREKDRQYKEQNREKIRERDRMFLEENKERINEKRREKITCVCGCSINSSSRSKHEKTKKHQQYIANNTN
jgi:hypothetical protein